MPLIVPRRMRVRDGQLNFQTMGQKPVKINGIDLSLQGILRRSVHFPIVRLSAFRLEAHRVGRHARHQEDQSILRLNEPVSRFKISFFPWKGALATFRLCQAST